MSSFCVKRKYSGIEEEANVVILHLEKIFRYRGRGKCRHFVFRGNIQV